MPTVEENGGGLMVTIQRKTVEDIIAGREERGGVSGGVNGGVNDTNGGVNSNTTLLNHFTTCLFLISIDTFLLHYLKQ